MGSTPGKLRVDFKAVARRRDEVIAASRAGVAALLEHHGVDIYRGEASVAGPGKVLVRAGKLDHDGYQMHYTGEETLLETDHIVLATGSQPLSPAFAGPDNPFVVSSNRLISIGELPPRLAIIGGGVIGLEFATIFANLGSQVTIIEYLDRILAAMDPEISAELTRLLEKDGVRVVTGRQVVGVEPAASGAGGEVCAVDRRTGAVTSIQADAVLVAVGRKPVLQPAIFDRLGIAYSEKGIVVDAQMRTTVPGVWAVGDATGKSILAHVGIQQGIICAENIMQHVPGGREMDYSVIPTVVYSIPEVTGVGAVPAEMDGVTVVKVPFSANLRAEIEGCDEGFLKLWIKDDRLLAAQAIGHGVSENMQELANMIALGSPVSAVAEIIHAHPTYAEIVRTALEHAQGKAVDYYESKPRTLPAPASDRWG